MGRRFIWAAVVAVLAVASCTKSSESASDGGSPPPSAESSAPPATSETPPPTGAVSGGDVKYYDCTKLLSAAEATNATGVSVQFSNEEKGEAIKGQTYCQYFAPNSVSIAMAVATGPAYDKYFVPLMTAGKAAAEPIAGLGDEAGWSDKGNGLGFRVGSTGVTIIFTNTGGGSLGIADPKGAAITMGKLIASRL
jgi:hypothetical protein